MLAFLLFSAIGCTATAGVVAYLNRYLPSPSELPPVDELFPDLFPQPTGEPAPPPVETPAPQPEGITLLGPEIKHSFLIANLVVAPLTPDSISTITSLTGHHPLEVFQIHPQAATVTNLNPTTKGIPVGISVDDSGSIKNFGPQGLNSPELFSLFTNDTGSFSPAVLENQGTQLTFRHIDQERVFRKVEDQPGVAMTGTPILILNGQPAPIDTSIRTESGLSLYGSSLRRTVIAADFDAGILAVITAERSLPTIQEFLHSIGFNGSTSFAFAGGSSYPSLHLEKTPSAEINIIAGDETRIRSGDYRHTNYLVLNHATRYPVAGPGQEVTSLDELPEPYPLEQSSLGPLTLAPLGFSPERIQV